MLKLRKINVIPENLVSKSVNEKGTFDYKIDTSAKYTETYDRFAKLVKFNLFFLFKSKYSLRVQSYMCYKST